MTNFEVCSIVHQNRTGRAEEEVVRLQGELRSAQESNKNLESDLKTLRRDFARSEEQGEAAEKMLSGLHTKADACMTKLRQVETELKEKESELEGAMLSTDRVQAELIHERRLTQAARTQSESTTKDLHLVTAKLSEEKQKTRELQNQVIDLERRVSVLSADLEAREAAIDGANNELSALSLCRKELQTAKLNLEQAQMSLQDCLPGKEKAERELMKIRHHYNELITKEMDASEQARLLQVLPHEVRRVQDVRQACIICEERAVLCTVYLGLEGTGIAGGIGNGFSTFDVGFATCSASSTARKNRSISMLVSSL